jgi:SAM-dependent methyltransferase
MATIQQARDHWEVEYRKGLWTHLHSDREFAHYTVVAGYIQRGRKSFSLHDVGCGEGVILNYLDCALIRSYTGVDIAQAAIDKIPLRRSQDRFIRSNLEDYVPNGQWDVILFNEILYYTSDPVAQLRKFERSLMPKGCFVISMHRKANPLAWNNRCIRKVRRYFQRARYPIEDAVEVSRIKGSGSWQVFVVQPPAV